MRMTTRQIEAHRTVVDRYERPDTPRERDPRYTNAQLATLDRAPVTRAQYARFEAKKFRSI